MFPALIGRFFTTEPPGKSQKSCSLKQKRAITRILHKTWESSHLWLSLPLSVSSCKPHPPASLCICTLFFLHPAFSAPQAMWHAVVYASQLHILCKSLWPQGLYPTRLLCHGVLQGRILGWVAFTFSRGSSWPRDKICVSCIAGSFFTDWATREVLILYTVPLKRETDFCLRFKFPRKGIWLA